MAHLIFESFNDNQTALAVQSLLESQSIPESIPVDDDDLFQCGKCKREFTNLMNFLSHKQSQCVGEAAVSANVSQPLTLRTSMDLNTSNASIVYTTHLGHAITKQLNGFGGVSLSSLVPGMVLGDEIISFHTVDSSSSMPLSSAIQGGPYLSQVEPITLNVKNSGPTIYSTIGEPTFAASTGDYSGVIDSSQLQFQRIATPSESQVELQQVIISMAQPESAVEALFSSQMHPSDNVVDPSNHDRKMRSTFDGVPTVADFNGPMTRQGKVPIAPVCSSVAGSTPAEDATRKKLKCKYCDKSFLKNFDLQQHLRSHTGEKPFQCIVCGRAFAQKSNVKKHMQTHKVWPQGLSNTLPTPVIVPVVTKSDNSAAAAAAATASVPISLPSTGDQSQATNAAVDAESDRVQVVMNCDSTTGQLFVKQWATMISVHQDTTSEGEKVNVVVDNSYICQYCGSKFSSYFQLKSHLVIHKNEQVYKCVLKSCGECFRELDEFLEHTKIHENEMTYRCYVCNKTFSSLYELGTHQYSHSLFPNQGQKLGPKYFRCVKCKNKYATPEALQHHLETTSHNFPCPYCSKLFACERYLRRHLPTHGTVGEYRCEVCMKPFKTEHYLKMHMVTHSDKKPFHCDKCSRSFNRRDKLKRHLLIHDPVKKFKCPFRSVGGCTKEFSRGDKLKAHIISHTGIKPYKCKICNKFFTRRPHLREHERTHTNSFQYSCSRCGKGFRRQKLLREHACCSGSKEYSSPESPADSKEAVIKSIAEAKGTSFPKKKVITNKVAIPKRGRPPKQVMTVSTALQSDLSSIVSSINDSRNNPKTEQQPVSLDQSSSLAIANMIAIEQPSGSDNLIAIDQALDTCSSSVQGCVDGTVGSVLTLEQSADGTFYIIKPYLGKVEDLSALVEPSSSSVETLRTIPFMGRRSAVEDRMTLLKSSRLVGAGQTAIFVNSSQNDHIPKTEVAEGLCQVIFTDGGTTG